MSREKVPIYRLGIFSGIDVPFRPLDSFGLPRIWKLIWIMIEDSVSSGTLRPNTR